MTEDQLEQEALGWLADVGWQHRYGPELAPEGTAPERGDYREVLLSDRLRQFSITGLHHTRRPDIILFVNGLPLVLIELKNPADQNADVWKAFHQIQTYKEQDDGGLVKKIAGYHQFHAVRAAIAQVIAVSRPDGLPSVRGKGGVVWHTQGSGKSITMTCFAARVMQEPLMENPTIVVITDRNDLDGQLFGVFSLAQDLLRERPAATRLATPSTCAMHCPRHLRGLHRHAGVGRVAPTA